MCLGAAVIGILDFGFWILDFAKPSGFLTVEQDKTRQDFALTETVGMQTRGLDRSIPSLDPNSIYSLPNHTFI
jgi:hypothetical protein